MLLDCTFAALQCGSTCPGFELFSGAFSWQITKSWKFKTEEKVFTIYHNSDKKLPSAVLTGISRFMALLFAAATGACVSYLAYRRKARAAVGTETDNASSSNTLETENSVRHNAGQPKHGKRVAIVTGGSR